MANEHENLDNVLANELVGLNQRTQERGPSERQKLGFFTVVCLILNRTIGSGIFVTPRNVLWSTQSVGVSLLLWVIGAIASTSGLLVWLELGLSIPRRVTPDGRLQNVPRSGGEKNYLEYMLEKPKFLVTCWYGIIFIVLGNLSGNAVQFGIYIMNAAGYSDSEAYHGQVLALAIGAITVACLLHVFSRRGGILLSNFFAVFKILVLLAIIVIGFAVAAGAIAPGKSEKSNLDVKHSFDNPSKSVASYTLSLLNIFYTFSGFEQPFYVLSEVRSPRKIFPRATLTAMGIASVLFFLVNVAYISAIPVSPAFFASTPDSARDMTTVFFSHIFGPAVAPRVMAGVVAACIFGNIIVMTFTASRVKQEIAKEGILPFSLFFATGHTTPDAWIRQKIHARRLRRARQFSRTSYSFPPNAPSPFGPNADAEDAILAYPEQTPMAALGLHWFMSVLLISVTSKLSPSIAYNVLVFLYSYVLVVLIPFTVSLGLLVLKLTPSFAWSSSQSFRPLGGPLAAMIYATISLFLLITAFLDPGSTGPWSYGQNHVKWWIMPTIGISTVLWGPVWWLGLRGVMWKRGLELVVTRLPHIEQAEEDGEWVQKAELIDHVWQSRTYARKSRREGSEGETGEERA